MRITVRVTAGARTESVVPTDSNSLNVHVHARAHDGEANEAVVKLVAKHYDVAPSLVRIVRGATSKIKVVEIT